MKPSLRWILVMVAACALCSAATYGIGHHRGLQHGYWNGYDAGLREGSYTRSLALLSSLQFIRAGDLPRAIHFTEENCFISAHTFFINPVAKTGEPADGPNADMARDLAKGLSVYRAAYRTNSADWDKYENGLEVQLAKIKSDDPKAWDSIVIAPVDAAREALPAK